MKKTDSDKTRQTCKRDLFGWLSTINYLGETEWTQFEHSVNRLYDDFPQKITRCFPTLSREDIRILLLLRINLDSLEIARLLHILPGSLRMRRWRLKKKMGVECESLAEYIRSMEI